MGRKQGKNGSKAVLNKLVSSYERFNLYIEKTLEKKIWEGRYDPHKKTFKNVDLKD